MVGVTGLAMVVVSVKGEPITETLKGVVELVAAGNIKEGMADVVGAERFSASVDMLEAI